VTSYLEFVGVSEFVEVGGKAALVTLSQNARGGQLFGFRIDYGSESSYFSPHCYDSMFDAIKEGKKKAFNELWAQIRKTDTVPCPEYTVVPFVFPVEDSNRIALVSIFTAPSAPEEHPRYCYQIETERDLDHSAKDYEGVFEAAEQGRIAARAMLKLEKAEAEHGSVQASTKRVIDALRELKKVGADVENLTVSPPTEAEERAQEQKIFNIIVEVRHVALHVKAASSAHILGETVVIHGFVGGVETRIDISQLPGEGLRWCRRALNMTPVIVRYDDKDRRRDD
jgi:hypothetical protein